MGTKVHCRSYLPGFYSMRDLNEDSSSSSWPVFYGDNNTVTNGQYCNGYMPRNSINDYPGQNDKEALKQKMLEHEAVFKDQVSELHRLYRVQRDMMEEIKSKELDNRRASVEPASSSSLQGSIVPSENNRKWHMAGFSLLNSNYARTPTSESELVKSPKSCTKGNTTQPDQFPLQNGQASKDVEAMDSRPSKVRKKLFDLHLPAEEYIDTEDGEKLLGNKGYACNGNPSNGPESSTKLLLDNHGGMRTDCRVVASASTSCLRGSIGLADLNDPAQIDEVMAPSSVDFIGHTSQNEETRGISQPKKSNAGYSSFENKANDGGRFLHTYEAGSTRSNLSSVGQVRPMQGIVNQFHHPSGIYSTGYHREDQWKDRPRHSFEFSDRNHDRPVNSPLGPMTSQTPNSLPFCGSSHVTSLWDQSISPWPKPTSSFAQNVIPLQPSACQSVEPFGGKWQMNASSSLNPGLRINKSKLNGFCEASASGSKGAQVDLPSVRAGYLNRSRGDHQASDNSINHGFGKFPKGSCYKDPKPVIDINLNEASSDEIVILQDLNKTGGKGMPEDHMSALPWLKPKPAWVTEGANCHKNVRDLNQPFPPTGMLVSSVCENAQKRRVSQSEPQTVKKLLGFPIFETGIAANKMSSLASTSESVNHHPEGKNSHKRKNRMIDINVECGPDLITEEPDVDIREEQEKCAHVRDYIDLNSCASDCEDFLVLDSDRKSAGVKITLEIDLEAPASMESDEDGDNALTEGNIPSSAVVPSLENKNEQVQDEVSTNSAELLFVISAWCPQLHNTYDSTCLPSVPSLDETLLLFVEAVASCTTELENTSGKESRSDDEFEMMTLQLPEMKEADYMPKPSVPEVPMTVDDTGSNALSSRSRRGQSRRGRQRRDFQRDILPGLTSLSRHEVTEDLQTFGGIMRATGHPWNSGLTRRNGSRGGGARGRRRAAAEAAVPATIPTPPVQQYTNSEGGLEDRSLMGWGKTTRRPRRQRCHSGNAPIALT